MFVSNTFMRLGVIAALIGMGLGVWMGAHQDFALRPVHAHINLLGFVIWMIYGLFYRLLPQASAGRLPMVHLVLAVVGLLLMGPGLAMVILGHEEVLPALVAGEFTSLASMLLFAFIVFRATGRTTAAA